MLSAPSFFDLSDFDHRAIFQDTVPAWDALKMLKSYMNGLDYGLFCHEHLQNGVPLACPLIVHNGKLQTAEGCAITFGDATKGKLRVVREDQELSGASVIMAGAVIMGSRILLGKGVLIESGALIKEPAVIGDCTEIRQGAYLRGYCLAGKRCVLGHATEVKHSIFLNDAKAGHFAYLGDSILGNEANLGAGTKFANLRFLPGNVSIKTPSGVLDSGLRKFGAILGDRVQTGCNSVTNPGTLLGKDSLLMPNTTAPSGYHSPKSMLR
ncbi:MAG: transferase hexapeptide (six repeat-containing protein) [Candidatus Electronema aureum]|uniref:Transferase hexapeptide (Six repeat-containing protein) n=1 Tax=Candidatus Electronema aureum TaxID=2005002 RepID=A0A521G4M4_9BACT|nr:MAG: transferase hexapeptide (six repeat-containing protein) [Candidatus Electronema aureum]